MLTDKKERKEIVSNKVHVLLLGTFSHIAYHPGHLPPHD